MLLGAFGLGLFSHALSIAIPLCIGKFYQLAFDGGSARSGLFDALFGHIAGMTPFFVLFFSILILRFLLQWGARYSANSLSENITARLREDLFRTQLSAPYGASGRNTAGMLTRFTGDMQSIQRLITKGYIGRITDITFLILVTGVFFLLDPRIAVYMLLAVPVLTGLTVITQQRMLPAYAAKRRARTRHLSFITERLYAINTIKLLNRITPETEKMQKRSHALLAANLRYQRWNAFHAAVYPLIAYLLLGGMMATAYFVSKTPGGHTDPGTLIVCIMLGIQVSPVLKSILRSGSIRRQGAISWHRIDQQLQQPGEWLDKQQLVISSGHLQIRDIHFGYADKPVFTGFSCTVPAHGITLITGEKGSGKTTLFKLLSGLYRPSSGHITLDLHDYATLSAFTIRKQVTWISAELPLVGKSVFEAVSYSRAAGKRRKVLAMLAAVGYCAADDTAALDKPIADGGKDLSSGERQLLRIARGLLTDKRVILLDEPFQGLDPAATERVQEILNRLAATHTIAVITADHRAGLEITHHVHLDQPQPLYA